MLVMSTVTLGQDDTGVADADTTADLPMGRLLWTSDRARDGGLSVWVLEAGTDGPRRLTMGDANDFSAELSPDGTTLVLASDRDNPNALTARGSYLRAYDIYLAGVDGGEPQRLHGDRTFKMRPTWSPDGSLIAFDGEDPDGEPVAETGGLTPQIWVVPSDGSGAPEMLTAEPAGALDPAWSPDGSRIAYRSRGDGRIISMASDGSDARPLTDGPGDAEPAWSPDGTRIVFSSERSGDREIYVMAADGSDVTQLTDSPDFDGQPTWSPDGTMIAFATDRGASRDIYLMQADGSGQVDVSANGPSDDGEHRGSDFSPSWSE
jgi:TolB protein